MKRVEGIVIVMTLLASGCAPVAGRDAPLQPLVAGAEQHLAIDWRPEPRAGGAVIWGYVTNRSPYTFDQVRLLVEALEPTGQIITQRVIWAPGLLGGWGRNYFETPIVAAKDYRVRVFSYDRVESDGRDRIRW